MLHVCCGCLYARMRGSGGHDNGTLTSRVLLEALRPVAVVRCWQPHHLAPFGWQLPHDLPLQAPHHHLLQVHNVTASAGASILALQRRQKQARKTLHMFMMR